MNFIHLKTQSEYSITQGINTIKGLIKCAKEHQMGAVALTDRNGLFGALQFYEESIKNGIKPIIGLDALIQDDDGNIYNLTLLAKNINGYREIVTLNSKGYTENRSNKGGFIKEAWLENAKDVIVLSGAKHGRIGQLILADKHEQALIIAKKFKNIFKDDFFIELQRDGSSDETKYMEGAVSICAKTNISPVATHPVFFEKPEDFFAHEARFCISNQYKVFDLKRERPFNKEMYFKSNAEMVELFSDIPVAIENTKAIATKCNIILDLNMPALPAFPVPEGVSSDEYFRQLATSGLNNRLISLFPSKIDRYKNTPIYFKRLNEEIEIIQKMGFSGYFLIVADFINWAKSRDIPVGPGRGSGAGSLVAYSMSITDINPLEFGLLFERFLNPDRVSMPDFDIDFCQTRRNEVYEYVKTKYGTQSVCQIGTFGTMAAKAVIRDVGRTLEYSYDFVDSLAKMVNIKPNHPMSLKEFLFGDDKKNIYPDEKLLERYENETDVKKLIDIALKLEGLTKQTGLHAAGVVIANGNLTDFSPLYTSDVDAPIQTQFEMTDVEKAGLVKFDFLGLKTLTVIKDAVRLIHESEMQKNGIKTFDLDNISYNDQNVFKNIYANGNTVGIFQFESSGMAATLKKAEPEKLQDLIAINALYRPGPMEIIPEWLESKKTPEELRQYPHPLLKEILSETYGFMIYQEQVMQCAQIIAGYTLGQADLLRRAMGKKKPEEMEKQREFFIQGAQKNELSKEKASDLFNLIEKFSGYGFNKSHAAAYSYLSYQLGFIKQYYPEQFYTANLNLLIGVLDTDKISILFQDAKLNGIKIIAPDVNLSQDVFSIEPSGAIRYGLNAIKGVGEKASQAIINERKRGGSFLDFYDFFERAVKGPVNKRVIEALIKSGAFDWHNKNRSELFENVGIMLDYAAKFRKKQIEFSSVFGDALVDSRNSNLKSKRRHQSKELSRPILQEFPHWDILNEAKAEKSAFGFYFTSNPYENHYLRELGGFQSSVRLSNVPEKFFNEAKNEFLIGGLIEGINWWKSKKGAFVTISDGSSTVEARMFESELIKNKDWFNQDNFAGCILGVEYSDIEDKPLYAIKAAFDLASIKKATIKRVYVGFHGEEDKIKLFSEILTPFKKNKQLAKNEIILVNVNKQKERISCVLNVDINEDILDKLTDAFGKEWVKIVFKDNVQPCELLTAEKKPYFKGGRSMVKTAFSN